MPSEETLFVVTSGTSPNNNKRKPTVQTTIKDTNTNSIKKTKTNITNALLERIAISLLDHTQITEDIIDEAVANELVKSKDASTQASRSVFVIDE